MKFNILPIAILILLCPKINAQIVIPNGYFSEIEGDRTRLLKLKGEPNTFIDLFLPGRSEEQGEIHLWESGNLDIGTSSFNDGGNLFLRTAGTRRVVIDEYGDVGIGTEHPQSKLFLEGGKFGISNNGHDWYQHVTPDADFYLTTPFDTVVTISQQKANMQLHGDYDFTISHGKLRFKRHVNMYFSPGFFFPNGQFDWELYPRIDDGPEACWVNNSNLPGPLEPPVHDFFFNVDGIEVSKICQNTGNYTVLSDSTMKKDIAPLDDVLVSVMNLKPVTYFYKKDTYNRDRTLGFIAQEVEQEFPELIERMGDKIGLNYDEFAAISIKAIQEQQVIINSLIDANRILTSELSKLKSSIDHVLLDESQSEDRNLYSER